MAKKSKPSVFLQFEINQENEKVWKIPPNYMSAIEDHLVCVPTVFFLPWLLDRIPSVGDKFYFPNMIVLSEALVKEVEYDYLKRRGVIVYVTLEPSEKTPHHDFNEYALTYAAEEGFLFEDKTPISKVLKARGFPTTRKSMKKVRG